MKEKKITIKYQFAIRHHFLIEFEDSIAVVTLRACKVTFHVVSTIYE